MSTVDSRVRAHLPSKLPACMGGWCLVRENCQRYSACTGADPVERLCQPGLDGVLKGYAVCLYRPAVTWERAHSPSRYGLPGCIA